MRYKVLLLTSGVGSRLGNITQYTNKALVRVGKKPAICHIIDCYNEDIEFVITLGYFGKQVKEFLELAYPNRKFNFVWVDNYDGQGSSVLYSLLQAENAIDCPFVFHTCDTLIDIDNIPDPSDNWMGGYIGGDSTQYATLGIMNNSIADVYPKGQSNFDAVYVGLAGYHNYKKFFKEAQNVYDNDPDNDQLSDIHVASSLIRKGIGFKHIDFPSWLDIGNIDKLKEARKRFEGIGVLDKDTESIYILNDRVIKFFYDESMVSKRVARAKILNGLTPKIINSTANFYSYEYVIGDLLSEVLNPKLMSEFLAWSKTNLWKDLGTKSKKFYKTCKKFYFDKTKERIYKFFASHAIMDEEEVINGELVPKIFDMLDTISEDYLCDVYPYNFHGDYIPDNILVAGNKFILLDWRQDFGGELKKGDIYYDLGKLNHNLIFNHRIINNGHFSISKNGDIKVDLLMSNNLYNCQKVLFNFLDQEGFSKNKVNMMSAIIWLNMSSLHNYPLDIFLYYFGKINLFKALEFNLWQTKNIYT
jgi:dTDP-glucose pyrophosphorylase